MITDKLDNLAIRRRRQRGRGRRRCRRRITDEKYRRVVLVPAAHEGGTQRRRRPPTAPGGERDDEGKGRTTVVVQLLGFTSSVFVFFFPLHAHRTQTIHTTTVELNRRPSWLFFTFGCVWVTLLRLWVAPRWLARCRHCPVGHFWFLHHYGFLWENIEMKWE